MKKPIDILKDFFGYPSFRKGQDVLIEHILKGRDVLGVMPTGAGKSLCYQVPALCLGGLSVVVSPLISLMKDQVDALRQNGVGAATLHSSMDWDEARQIYGRVRSGEITLLYVAPERFDNASFREFFASLDVKIFVIDEAHCVSQWGHDFRPSYLALADVAALLPKRPVVAAFTATATADVRDDIALRLNLKNPFILTTGFDRENLFFRVEHPRNKTDFLLRYVNTEKNSLSSGIVYCSTRRAVEEVCDRLRDAEISAVRYHAGLSDEDRERNQEAFIYDRAAVMVATNAFGMGIDKSNVRYVVHYNMPGSIDSYYQEAGRGGRDGLPAECVLLFAPKDVMTARYFIDNAQDAQNNETDSDYADTKRNAYQKLQHMIDYCNTSRCLRVYILSYFGESPTAQNCASCGNCASSEAELSDVTTEAKKILSCVYRMEERTGQNFGAALLNDVLRGSQRERVKTLELDKISTWGLMKEYRKPAVKEIIDFLIADGYLEVMVGEYPVVRFTDHARPFLRGQEKLFMRRHEPRQQESDEAQEAKKTNWAAGKKYGERYEEKNSELFEQLRALRRALADAAKVPPYIIFSDATLRGMCASLPKTHAAFLAIPGVGQIKLEKYGDAFLRVIREWTEDGGR
ncbi:ATP-dependent DNA helicase RecQ [Synergistales bacterium]|nr:ATP-dependent DNA helicase RecQ [Synergistales bacterium]